MKKLLTIALAVAMAFSVTACSGGSGATAAQKDAYELYQDMNTEMAKVKSVEMATDAKVDVAVMGQNMQMTMKGTTTQILHSETEIDMEMKMDMDVMGQSYNTVSYYKGGFLYQDVGGTKMKMTLNMDEALAQGNMMENMDFPKEAVVVSEVSDEADGKRLSFTLDGSKMTDSIREMVDSTLSGLGLGEISMDLDDVAYEVVVGQDNLPVSMNMKYKMTMDVEGESADMSYDITMNMSSFNSIDSIAFPEDLDDYPEYTM